MSQTIPSNISSAMAPAQYNLSALRPASSLDVPENPNYVSFSTDNTTTSSYTAPLQRSSTPTRISLSNNPRSTVVNSEYNQLPTTTSPKVNNAPKVNNDKIVNPSSKDDKGLKFDCVTGYSWLNDKAFWGFVIISLISVIIGWITGIGDLDENWYNNLIKPSYMPPSYVIFAIWVVFNFITAYIGYAGHTQARTLQERNISNLLFIVQLALNLIWIILFFGQENPAGSFWVAIFAFITVLLWMLLLARINKTLAIIALAFLVWIAFTIAFNWEIVTLNKV